MPWLILAGIGGLVLLISSSASARTPSGGGSAHTPTNGAGQKDIVNGVDPKDIIGSVVKQIATPTTMTNGEINDAQKDFWIDYYKKKGNVHPPPEYSIDPADIGMSGDIAQMPRGEAAMVIGALFEDENSSQLLGLADDVEEAGYPVAAARLRQKAFRLIGATVTGYRTSIVEERFAARTSSS